MGISAASNRLQNSQSSPTYSLVSSFQPKGNHGSEICRNTRVSTSMMPVPTRQTRSRPTEDVCVKTCSPFGLSLFARAVGWDGICFTAQFAATTLFPRDSKHSSVFAGNVISLSRKRICVARISSACFTSVVRCRGRRLPREFHNLSMSTRGPPAGTERAEYVTI